jgi:hypothetical protein
MFASDGTARYSSRLHCGPIPRYPYLYAFRAVLVVCALLTAIIISGSLFWPGWTTSLAHPIFLNLPFNKPPEQPPALSPAQPSTAILKSSLRKLCDDTIWTEGLWLSCHSHCGLDEEAICGGLNNARSRLQTCIRLAIDAGAGLVLPTFMTRSETTLRPHDGSDEVCAGEFWNSRQLADNLKVQCPQLEIRFCGNTTGLGPKIESSGTRHYNNPSHTYGTFKKLVEEDLATHNITNITTSNPIRVDFWDSMFSWNYTESLEAETIQKELFKVLLYNADLLQLGAEIFSLIDRYAPFIGIHLRGERDWPAFYGDVDQQMEHYMEDLERLQNTTTEDVTNIYISCGDRKAIELFRQKLKPLHYTVHDKWTLLANHPDIHAKMENLTFDQKGIVEYTTLTSADYFFGVGMSSMSLLIAYARTIDEESEYFMKYIYPNSIRNSPLHRQYTGSPVMKGNKKTRLLMVSGPDILDRFP